MVDDTITELMETAMALQWIGRAMEQVGDSLESEGAAYAIHFLGGRIMEAATVLDDAQVDTFLAQQSSVENEKAQ